MNVAGFEITPQLAAVVRCDRCFHVETLTNADPLALDADVIVWVSTHLRVHHPEVAS